MLTARDIAKRLAVSQRFVYDLAARGVLPCYRIGGAVRFDPADLDAYLASCRVTAPSKPRVPGGPTVKLSMRDSDEELRRFFESKGLRRREKTPRK